MTKDVTKNIDIRRYISWKKIVKGKPIHIRLYELVYYELLITWLEMGKPPIRSAIYEMINRKEFNEDFIKGQKYNNLLMKLKITNAMMDLAIIFQVQMRCWLKKILKTSIKLNMR